MTAPKLALTLPELAEAINKDLATIYRMRARRELPVPIFYIGRSPRVRTVDVEAWLARLAEEASEEQRPLARRTPATRKIVAGVPSILPARRGGSREA